MSTVFRTIVFAAALAGLASAASASDCTDGYGGNGGYGSGKTDAGSFFDELKRNGN